MLFSTRHATLFSQFCGVKLKKKLILISDSVTRTRKKVLQMGEFRCLAFIRNEICIDEPNRRNFHIFSPKHKKVLEAGKG